MKDYLTKRPNLITASRILLWSFLLGVSGLPAISLAAEEANTAKPNILLIVADDLGYSDLGCYGGEIQTPNLDRVAANGLRFTQFYNTSRCWSSRASLLSGYYAQAIRRDPMTGDFKPKASKGARPRWAQLLPVYLKSLGYHSYYSGKWHIDGSALQNGFERSYDATSINGFFDSAGHKADGKLVPPSAKDGEYYATTATADYAIQHLTDHANRYPGKPFFHYLAFNAPHYPLHALPKDIAVYKDRYKTGWDSIRTERLERLKRMGVLDCALSPLDPNIVPRWNLNEAALKKNIGPFEVGHALPWDSLTPDQEQFQASKMEVHAAMVHRMDLEIGRVLAHLKSTGAIDNTIVIFLSDNGASAEQIIRGNGHDPTAPVGSAKTFLGMGPGWASASNTPFRLHKSWVHEGGIATPLIVSWPAGLKARNELRTNPGHLIDIVPTLLEITGAKQPETIGGLKVPPMHGKSLVPDFIKDGSVKREYLWWDHDGNRAIRMGDWKLVANGKLPWELYNLAEDRSETKNLAENNPEKVAELEKAWRHHAEEFNTLALQDQRAGRKNSTKDEE